MSWTPPSPYQLVDPQDWAVQQARLHHDEALYRVGEYAIFYILWRVVDHEAGLVGRCPVCYIAHGRAAEAFKQGGVARCAACLGTTFEGGWKGRIIRPAIVAYTDEVDTDDRRGNYQNARADIQSTSDFTLDTGDIIVRGDGRRWVVKGSNSVNLHTGFEVATRGRTALGWAYGQCALEEETSVVYTAPPSSAADLMALLDPRHPHHPQVFDGFEVVRAPLVPVTPTPSDPPSGLTWGDLEGTPWGDVPWGETVP